MIDQQSEQEKRSFSKTKGRRPWLFRLLALTLVPSVFLVLTELSLRLTGVGYPSSFTVKQTVNGQAVASDNPKFIWKYFPRSLARPSFSFNIPETKSPQTYRIFVLGGSAAQGMPEPAFGFSRILGVMLEERYPGVNFEVYNTGITAINSRVVRDIAKDCAKHAPDLFVVYLGNNESVGPYGAGTIITAHGQDLTFIRLQPFLRSLRLYQLLEDWVGVSQSEAKILNRWRGMQMFVDHQIRADDDRLKETYQKFRENLESICRTARNGEIPIVLSTVAVNLKDSPPFGSLHRAGLSGAAKEKWDALYRKGESLQSQQEYEKALGAYRAASAIDDSFADLHWRLAQCHSQLDQDDQARRHYLEARKQDTLRFRADSGINQTIRNVATAQNDAEVVLLDSEKVFSERSPRKIAGAEYFHEHVHLNFRGNTLLARSLLEKLENLLPSWIEQKQSSAALLTEEDCMTRLAFTAWNRYQIEAYLCEGYFTHPPFTRQLGYLQRLERVKEKLEGGRQALTAEALEHMERVYWDALSKRPDDIWLRYNYARFLLRGRGDHRRALQQSQIVADRVPQCYLVQNFVAYRLLDVGHYFDAATIFQKQLELMPFSAQSHTGLGIALSGQGRVAEATELFRDAIGLAPDHVRAYQELSESLANGGEVSEAIEVMRQGVQEMPEEPGLLKDLGALLIRQGSVPEGIRWCQQAVAYSPDHLAAHMILGTAYRQQGKLSEAIRHWEHVVRIDPGRPGLHFKMGGVYSRLKRPDDAAEHFRKVLQLDAQQFEAHNMLAEIFHEQEKPGKAVTHLTQSLALRARQPGSLNLLAWLKAVYPGTSFYDPAEAVLLARQCCELTESGNPQYLDTLAVTYSASGDFTKAVEVTKKAIALVELRKQPKFLDLLKRRLDLYAKAATVPESEN